MSKQHKWEKPYFKDDDYFMPPRRARLLLEHIMNVYNLTRNDVHYMTGISSRTIDKIMQDNVYSLSSQTADAIITLYKHLWPKEMKYFRSTNDWLEKLIYYLHNGNRSYRQTKLKHFMLGRRRKWNQREWDIFDILDIEKSIKEKEIYYQKDFLDRLLKTNDNYFFFALDMEKTRATERYPKGMNKYDLEKWIKLFMNSFIEFPSDLYNKYLRLSFKRTHHVPTKAREWKEKEQVWDKGFIFCF